MQIHQSLRVSIYWECLLYHAKEFVQPAQPGRRKLAVFCGKSIFTNAILSIILYTEIDSRGSFK